MRAQLFSIKLLLFFCLTTGQAITAEAYSIYYHDISEIAGIAWQTPAPTPSPGSKEALRGSNFIRAIAKYPENLRRIGPDTPNNMAAVLNSLQLPLMAKLSDTDTYIPILASQWAVSADNKLLLYRLDADASWSDDIILNTADIAFSALFITDPDTGASWQKQQLEQLTDGVNIYSDTVFAFRLKNYNSDIQKQLNDFRPFARHIYEGNRSWPNGFDWYPEPTGGPYFLTQIQPDQSLTFRRKDNWWGEKLPYFRHRFNPERIIFRRMKNDETEAGLFAVGELSAIEYPQVSYWQSPVIKQIVNTKKINLFRFYHHAEQAPAGLLVNPRIKSITNSHERAWLAKQLGMNSSVYNLSGERLIQQRGLSGNYSLDEQRKPEPIPPGVIPEILTLSYTDIRDKVFLQSLQQTAEKAGIRLELNRLSGRELQEKLALASYELVWLRFNAPLSPAGIASLFDKYTGDIFISGISQASARATENNKYKAARETERYLMKEFIYLPGYSSQYTQAAFWRWIHLPDPPANEYSQQLFDPFDPVHGGLFWINRKERAEIMANPDQSRNTSTDLKIFNQYQTDSETPQPENKMN